MTTEDGRSRPGVIGRVVTWLRAGYPEGVPTGDYVALLGVLRRRLREEEIQEIVERLAAQRSLGVTPERIHELIREYSLQEPHEDDIARVTTLLASTGYPVEGEETLDQDQDQDEDQDQEPQQDQTKDNGTADDEERPDAEGERP